MAKDLRFYPDMPKGMRLWSAAEEVSGIHYHISNARAFAKGNNPELRFEPEPGNLHDSNAIKVIGIYKGWFYTYSKFIGYVAAETAACIAEHDMIGNILPRLKNIWWGGYVEDFIVVRFDIVTIITPQEEAETKRKPKRIKKKKSAE